MRKLFMRVSSVNQIVTMIMTIVAVNLVGCKTMSATDMMSTGSSLLEATSITDAQMMQEARAAAVASDQNNILAPSNSKYQKRVNKLAKN
ncbi:hypothetical protein CXB77_11955 [Chromatium okenii]|uniref:Uncharacterized protein n=1 Tax=Chromatium okenii TaxID=61644 RepID=A0A2S7XNP3_9GAMM|nr:hypothetical protein CXB77_11955 [Chromatium okenii]